MFSIKEIVNGRVNLDLLAKKVSEGNLKMNEYRYAAGAFIYDNDYEAAEYVLERALEENKHKEIHLLRGDLLLAQGKSDEAMFEWSETEKKLPGLAGKASARMAFCSYLTGDKNMAVSILKKCNSDVEVEICKMIIHFEEKRFTYAEYIHNAGLLKASESIIKEYFSVLEYLRSAESNKSVLEQMLEKVKWLNIWLPYQPVAELMELLLGLHDANYVSDRVLMRFKKKTPLAVVLLFQKTEKKAEKLSILKNGLATFPRNDDLIKAYIEETPPDPWIIDHLIDHGLPVPNNIAEMINKESEHTFSNKYIEAISDNSKKVSVTALGGGQSIGASAYVVSYGGRSIMLDCGLNPNKHGPAAYPELDRWNHQIDAMVISHGHLDHCGALPKAHAMWKNALIYGTEGTRAVVELLFNDMLRINRRNHDREIYTDTLEEKEMKETLDSFVSLGYLTWEQVFDNCKIRFHHAGHITGAAMVEIVWDGVQIVFSGDFCLHNQKLLPGANLSHLPQNPDILITEATYAFKKNVDSWDRQLEDLLKAIKITINNGGTVLLPSFAIGRSQELVYALGEAYEKGFLGEHIDFSLGGMAHDACYISKKVLENPVFNHYLKRFNKIAHNEPIPVRSVIVASSGMMIKNSASYNIMREIKNSYNANNSRIFFCGYMDEETERENKQLISQNSGIGYDRYSLTAHAAAADIELLVNRLSPKSIICVHWGDSKIEKQNQYLDQMRKSKEFDCMVYTLQEGETIYPCDVNRWLINRKG